METSLIKKAKYYGQKAKEKNILSPSQCKDTQRLLKTPGAKSLPILVAWKDGFSESLIEETKFPEIEFKKAFAPLISKGKKIHTIRKYKVEVGTPIDCFYRSEQGDKIPFAHLWIKHLEEITISKGVATEEIRINGKRLSYLRKRRLVSTSGCSSMKELLNILFKGEESFYKGYIIHWTNFKHTQL